jgi:hypothetical protein
MDSFPDKPVAQLCGSNGELYLGVIKPSRCWRGNTYERTEATANGGVCWLWGRQKPPIYLTVLSKPLITRELLALSHLTLSHLTSYCLHLILGHQPSEHPANVTPRSHSRGSLLRLSGDLHPHRFRRPIRPVVQPLARRAYPSALFLYSQALLRH